MLPSVIPSMRTLGPSPRAFAQVCQVATSPRRAKEDIILSTL